MNQETLLLIVAGAVCVAALAIVIQMMILFGLYRTARSANEKLGILLPKTEALIQSAERTIVESRQQINEITTRAREVLDLTKAQVVRVEEILVDASGRAKSQIEHAELVLDDTLDRVHQTVTSVHRGLSRPAREINGVAKGIKAAINQLMRGDRTSVVHAAQEDEMFI